MRVIITGRHYDVSPRTKNMVEEKLSKIKYFYEHVIVFQVILEKEKLGFKAEVNFHADGKRFYMAQSAASVHEAVDALVDKLARQVERHKDRIKNRKHPSRRTDSPLPAQDKVERVEVPAGTRGELEVMGALAVSADEWLAFRNADRDGAVTLAVKEDEDLYSLTERDAETGRWIHKRVFLVDGAVEKSLLEDYALHVLSTHEAIETLTRHAAPALVFQDRATNAVLALAHGEGDAWLLVPLEG